MATSTYNREFAKRYGLEIGTDEKRGQLPAGANRHIRKKVLRATYAKMRNSPSETFSEWKARRLEEVASGS